MKNKLNINMTYLSKKSIYEVRPLELALIGKGVEKISLNDVTAELAKLEEDGYFRTEKNSEEDVKYVLLKEPDDNLPVYAKILLNGLFYKTRDVKANNIPLVFSYAVQESLVWLKFENRKSLKVIRKEYQKHISEFCNTDDLYFLCVLGFDKKYAKRHPEIYFSRFSDIYKSLARIITPGLTPVGRSVIGGFGRGLAGASGPFAGNGDVSNIENIDWNYMLYRE